MYVWSEINRYMDGRTHIQLGIRIYIQLQADRYMYFFYLPTNIPMYMNVFENVYYE